MELKLEEMQLYCEEQRKESEKLEHILIERDSKHCQEKDRLHEEIMSLKKKYVEDIKVKCCKGRSYLFIITLNDYSFCVLEGSLIRLSLNIVLILSNTLTEGSFGTVKL